MSGMMVDTNTNTNQTMLLSEVDRLAGWLAGWLVLQKRRDEAL